MYEIYRHMSLYAVICHGMSDSPWTAAILLLPSASLASFSRIPLEIDWSSSAVPTNNHSKIEQLNIALHLIVDVL